MPIAGLESSAYAYMVRIAANVLNWCQIKEVAYSVFDMQYDDKKIKTSWTSKRRLLLHGSATSNIPKERSFISSILFSVLWGKSIDSIINIAASCVSLHEDNRFNISTWFTNGNHIELYTIVVVTMFYYFLLNIGGTYIEGWKSMLQLPINCQLSMLVEYRPILGIVNFSV